ncbi:hypothetical protein AOU00_11365 [Paenibacillus polymyxa]|nr:hypothetical protein AOU00_11365 [Paenibacillus polymyxa]
MVVYKRGLQRLDANGFHLFERASLSILPSLNGARNADAADSQSGGQFLCRPALLIQDFAKSTIESEYDDHTAEFMNAKGRSSDMLSGF